MLTTASLILDGLYVQNIQDNLAYAMDPSDEKSVNEIYINLVTFIDNDDMLCFSEYLGELINYPLVKKIELRKLMVRKFLNTVVSDEFIDVFYNTLFPSKGTMTKATR